MSPRALWLVGIAILGVVPARAQRPVVPAAVPPKAPGSGPDSTLVVSSLFLRRDVVQRIAQQLALADKKKPQATGLLLSLQKTVAGDHYQVEAAKRALTAQAAALGADGRTVILVIGSDADSVKVRESLAGVRRKLRLAVANRDFSDNVSDNTVLRAGMAGAVTDAATNLWVFLPKKGPGNRDQPDRVLSTKVATPTLWNGMFAAEGDAIDVNQVKTLVAKHDTTPSAPAPVAANATGTDAPAPAYGSPAVGDVVVPKIANVKILAEPSSGAKVLGMVQKTDELVMTGAAQNGFVKVEGASLAGWVNLLLVTKR